MSASLRIVSKCEATDRITQAIHYNPCPPACRECLARITRANIARYVPTFAQGASEASGSLGMTGLTLDNESNDRLPLTHAPPLRG